MKYTQNRQETEKLDADFLGYIFYPPSKRYVGDVPEAGLFNSNKNRVGVFVNESVHKILSLAKACGLNYIQLHGRENPKTCLILKKQGLKIIKAFGVDENFRFATTKPYESACDFFLFDTSTALHGGSGKKFDWQALQQYNGAIPFFLSGGITPDDVENIRAFNHPRFAGVDVNSGFEEAPGIKNVPALKRFIEECV